MVPTEEDAGMGPRASLDMVADRKCPITVPAGTELLLSSHVEGIKN
jgi:hypothetical protein